MHRTDETQADRKVNVSPGEKGLEIEKDVPPKQ